MIYSKLRDFLFIKGRKVAGTSIEIALAGICGADDIITPLTRIDERERLLLSGRGAQNYSADSRAELRFLEGLRNGQRIPKPQQNYSDHMSLRKFIAQFGSLPTARIFCAERSPYAKLISAANMELGRSRYQKDGSPMVSERDALQKTLNVMVNDGAKMYRNIDLYRDALGRLNVHVIHYERLQEDFSELMRRFGISPVPTLPHAKRGINSNALHPSEMFSRAQLDKINAVFAEEFEIFGYETF